MKKVLAIAMLSMISFGCSKGVCDSYRSLDVNKKGKSINLSKSLEKNFKALSFDNQVINKKS